MFASPRTRTAAEQINGAARVNPPFWRMERCRYSTLTRLFSSREIAMHPLSLREPTALYAVQVSMPSGADLDPFSHSTATTRTDFAA